jgi:chemotaxis protein CheD
MNHFLLAGEGGERDLRYGAYATRYLIGELLKHGAKRERLEVSLFGGGRVISGQRDIGGANIDFIRAFVEHERLPVKEENLGGPYSRRVRYNPRTGVASMVILGA